MMPPNLLDLISCDTRLVRTSSRHGGEYSGPCPLCRTGRDRFKVWPKLGRWACLGSKAGRAGCGRGGDAAGYLMARDGLSAREACTSLGIGFTAPYARAARPPAPARPAPGPAWQSRASAWVADCQRTLHSPAGARAYTWLLARGLNPETILTYRLGYHPWNSYEARARWGLPPAGDAHGQARPVWLPRGIVIPWQIQGALWRINIRRPLRVCQLAAGRSKYMGPAGFGNGLYNADALRPGRPAVLVEGELDALTVQQTAGDLVTAVAAGSTGGARTVQWIGQLALCSQVLVAFDVDENQAGDLAANWWLSVLGNARRWRPLWADVNRMAMDGGDVREWVKAGLEQGPAPGAGPHA